RTLLLGTQRVPAGIASVIIGSVPLLTLLLAVLQRLEPFRVRGLAGAILSVLALVGAAAATAQAAITVRRIRDAEPLPVNAVGMAVGSVLLLLGAMVSG